MTPGPKALNSTLELQEGFQATPLDRAADKRVLNLNSQEMKQPFQNLLFSFLSNKNLANFSLSCRQAALWTKDQIETRAVAAASSLLGLAVQGNQDASMAMLQNNPGLILCNKGRVIDYSGKCIQGLTAFEAALCAGDLDMCVMMKDVCAKLEKGQEKLQAQYKALFPHGIEAYSKEQANAAFDFTDIIAAILKAPEDEVIAALNKEFDESKPLHKALSTFRAAFDKLSFDTQIFNPWNLVKAFKLYDENFHGIQSWNKRDLIWRQVVGYAQRHLPACYAQAVAQGLFYLIQDKEKLQRHFNFRFGDEPVFPLKIGDGLGFDFASPARGQACPGIGTDDCTAQFLETLFRAKTSILERAFQPAEKPQLLVCSVLK